MDTPGTGGSEPPEGPHLKGQLFLARLEYVRNAHGPSAIDEVLRGLPEEVGEQLCGVDRERWYPFSALIQLDLAIAGLETAGPAPRWQRDRAPGGTPGFTSGVPDDIFERLGSASSRHRTEWLGQHARLFSVHGFLSRVAEEHRRFHSFGHAAYRRTGFTEGEIAFSGYPEAYEIFCRSSVGYFRAAVESLAGGPAEVVERSCQCRAEPACVFHIRWRRPEADVARL